MVYIQRAVWGGRRRGEADIARVANLAALYRASWMGVKERMQMRYDASLRAVYLGHGCHHEEQQFIKFGKMADAMRYGDGSFAAGVGSMADCMGGKLMTVEEQVKGENLFAYWPGYLIRPAISGRKEPWESSFIESYAYMREAAVEYGIKANSKPFVPSKYAAWRHWLEAEEFIDKLLERMAKYGFRSKVPASWTERAFLVPYSRKFWR